MAAPHDCAATVSTERRVSVRYRCERPATSRAFISNSYRTLKAHIVDLSCEGIGLVLPEALEVGTRLTLELEGTGLIEVELLAEVVYNRQQADGTWRCGCTLVWKLSPDDLRLLLP